MVHILHENILDDGTEASCTGLTLDGLLCDLTKSVIIEAKLDTVHTEELTVLLGKSVLGFCQNANHIVLGQFVEGDVNRHTTDELGDQTKLDEVLRENLAEKFSDLALIMSLHISSEAHRGAVGTILNDLIESFESSTTDEEDILGIDLDQFLLGMLTSALRRYGCIGSLEDLQKSLLYAFTGYITGDRDILGLLGDLIDLIDVDDTNFSLLDIVVCSLDQLEKDVLNVFTDISCFGKGSCICNCKRNA